MLMFTLALLLCAAQHTSSIGVIQNPGFEASPFLAGWETSSQVQHKNGRAPTFAADRSHLKEGSQSLLVESQDPSDAAVSERVFLPVGSLWRVSAWIRTEDLSSADADHAGGYIRVQTPIGDVGGSEPLRLDLLAT